MLPARCQRARSGADDRHDDDHQRHRFTLPEPCLDPCQAAGAGRFSALVLIAISGLLLWNQYRGPLARPDDGGAARRSRAMTSAVQALLAKQEPAASWTGQAQALAIRMVNDALQRREYFWINDMDVRLITHPFGSTSTGGMSAASWTRRRATRCSCASSRSSTRRRRSSHNSGQPQAGAGEAGRRPLCGGFCALGLGHRLGHVYRRPARPVHPQP